MKYLTFIFMLNKEIKVANMDICKENLRPYSP